MAGVRAALPVFATVVVFSFFINLLLFVSPLYMLQIYDRVITSRSETTLLSLTVLAAILIGVYAALETLRSRLLVRAGLLLDEKIAEPVFNAVHRGNLRQPGANHAQALRDVDTVREFLTGAGLIALCDAPWFPLFVFAAFLLHPWFGYIALGRQRHYIEPDAPERNRNKEVAERRELGGDDGQSNGSIDVPQYGSAPGDGHASRHQNKLDSTARKHVNASGFG